MIIWKRKRKSRFLWFSLVMIGFIRPMGTSAQIDDTFLEPAGQFGGDALMGDVQGNYVYLSQGKGVSILQQNGDTYTVMDYLSLPEEVADLQVQDNYLYAVLQRSGGFYVVDITSPTGPEIAGSCDIASFYTAGLALSGHYAYAVTQVGGFKVVDISQPTQPQVVKTVRFSYPSDIAIENNLAASVITSASPNELELYDLADPTNPELLSAVDVEKANTVALSGDYAYIACADYSGGTNGLRIVNISNTSNPEKIAYLPTYEMAYAVLVEGNYAYLGLEDSLLIADLTDKASPQVVGRYQLPGATYSEVRCFHLENEKLYLAARYLDAPLQVVDVADPTKPVTGSIYESPGDIQSLLAIDTRLFVSSNKKLFAYDITDPIAPVFSKTYADFRGLAFMKTISGFIVGIHRKSLQFIDTRDPDNLSSYAEYTPVEGYPLNVGLGESRAYLQTDAGKIEIINTENPASPVLVSSFDIEGTIHDIALNGNLLFSAHEESDVPEGVEIFQLQNDVAVKLGNIETAGIPMTLWAGSDTLLVGSNESNEFHLVAYDLSTPSEPELIASVTDSGEIRDIDVRDGAILAAVIGQSVIGYTLDLLASSFEKVDVCHSPGSFQITAEDIRNRASKRRTYYTSEGVSYMQYPDKKDVQKKGNPVYSPASSTLMASGCYGVSIQTLTAKGRSSAGDNQKTGPKQFALWQNYPNPFNPVTTVEYAVKERCHVSLTIYDIRGREVMNLVDQNQQAGYYKTTFDASQLATGIYLCRIQMKNFVSVKKMMLLR